MDEQLIFTPWTVFITSKEKNFRGKELEKERFSEEDHLKRGHCDKSKEGSKVLGNAFTDIFIIFPKLNTS